MLRPYRSHRRAALVLLGTLLPALVQAQDLAAVAKKEKERRAKVTKPVKVLTEDDGKEAATKGSGSVTALGSEGAAANAPAEHQSGGAEAEAQKAAWKTRADSARAAVVNTEKTYAQMERDISAYRSDMTVVSAADAQDPMRLQKREAKLFEMTKQLEAQKTAIADAKKALTAFEDEARRSGVPAGWLR